MLAARFGGSPAGVPEIPSWCFVALQVVKDAADLQVWLPATPSLLCHDPAEVNGAQHSPGGIVQVSLVGGFVKGGGDTDFKATMIGFDENKDIAVLKINVPDKKVTAVKRP